MACLAGPVVAAALVVKPYCRKIPGVRDSKTLSLPQRERLYDEILKHAVAVGVGAASVTEINKINILRASHLAMSRATARPAVRPRADRRAADQARSTSGRTRPSSMATRSRTPSPRRPSWPKSPATA